MTKWSTPSLQRIAAENKMSMQQFAAALRNDGVTIEKFRDELKNEIIINRVRDREIESRVVVTTAKSTTIWRWRRRRVPIRPEYQLAHITVLVPEQATPDQVETRRKRAEEALRQLQDRHAVRQIAAVFSGIGMTPRRAVPLGWRQADRLPALYSIPPANCSPARSVTSCAAPMSFTLSV